MKTRQEIEEKYKSETLIWESRYFGGYTMSMTFMGLFLGMGSYYSLFSIVFFVISLYMYAKNKEQVELNELIRLNKEIK